MNQLPDDQLGRTAVSSGNTSPSPQSMVSGHVERDLGAGGEVPLQLEDVNFDHELPPELTRAGVVQHRESIEVPPDLLKMGVQAVGPTQPIAHIPIVTLPISDQKVLKGLRAKPNTSFRWLAEWCKYELERARIHLLIIAGKPVRRAF